MVESATNASWLVGKQVAVTGRLASMTRAEAALLIRRFGGELVAALTKSVAVLVIGQEGLPLQKDGEVSAKLAKAQLLKQLGHAIAIIPEDELLGRLGLEAQTGVHGLFTTAQLCRLLRVTRDRIRAWTKAGLLQPIKQVHGVSYFDFPQVAGIRTLVGLTRSGVTPKQLRRSLEQLRRWVPNLERPLAQLALIEQDGKLLVRQEGRLAEPSGQGLLDFAQEHVQEAVEVQPVPQTVEEWIALAGEHEAAERTAEAVAALRQALLLGGPDTQLCYNLANQLYASGQQAAAAERYRQAIELEPHFAEAWNNLGNVLAELEQFDEAVRAYRKALECRPDYADAHYNLAATLEERRHGLQAKPHWQAYLRLEPDGDSAVYARGRLAAIELERLG